MQSKTSWFKKELVKQDFRQVGWISLVYTLVLFFVIPLNIAMYLSQDRMDRYITNDTYTNLFEFTPIIQILAIFVAPVLLAITLFRYMQTKQSVDFMHSLPIKRQTIFMYKFGLGVALLVATNVIISLILVLMERSFDVSLFYTLSDIGPWFGLSLLLQTLVFTIATFVGMLTGLSAMQGIFTYILMFFPVGITTLIMYNLNNFLIGFPTNYLLEDQLSKYSPITYSWELLYEMNVTVVDISIYSLLILLFTGFSLLLYTNRKTEAASQTIAFLPLRPIFKYGFTFCMTLVGGTYFGIMQHHYAWVIFGYIFGSIIGYLLAQMMLKKTWRVFTDWKSYLYYVLACSILFILVSLDVTGYENRIPNLDDIEQVYVQERSPYYWQEGDIGEQYKGIKSAQLINEVRELHQTLIDSSDHSQAYGYEDSTIELKYDLNNGRHVIRKYNISNTSLDEHLKPIYESKEFKKMNEPIFAIDNRNIDYIEINEFANYYETVHVTSNEKRMASLIDVLQQDALNKSYQDMRHPTNALVEVAIYLNNDESPVYINIHPNDISFLNWLKDQGIYDELIVTADKVNAIYLKKFNIESGQVYNSEFYLDNEDVVKITNKEEISTLLQSISLRGNYVQEEIYGMAIDIKGMDEMLVESLEPTKVPDFVLEVIK
ncbi:DUF6449 domain-containing protein [Paraliobacillus sp. JSM ZJ581]|uniref:DUF6449 domain-containing protein n=1 Tax=Paraliobacillus sp. JSM ZJ581 TaxID=3342118 RepID=UPI0035A95C41